MRWRCPASGAVPRRRLPRVAALATVSLLLVAVLVVAGRPAPPGATPAGRTAHLVVSADARSALVLDRDEVAFRAVDALGRIVWVEEDRTRAGAYITCAATCAEVVFSSQLGVWHDLTIADPLPLLVTSDGQQVLDIEPSRKLRVLAGSGKDGWLVYRVDEQGRATVGHVGVSGEQVLAADVSPTMQWIASPSGQQGVLHTYNAADGSTAVLRFARTEHGWDLVGQRQYDLAVRGMCLDLEGSPSVMLSGMDALLVGAEGMTKVRTDIRATECHTGGRATVLVERREQGDRLSTRVRGVDGRGSAVWHHDSDAEALVSVSPADGTTLVSVPGRVTRYGEDGGVSDLASAHDALVYARDGTRIAVRGDGTVTFGATP